MQLEAVILLASVRGITAYIHVGHWRIKFFALPTKVEDIFIGNKNQKNHHIIKDSASLWQELFCNISKTSSEASTPTGRDDAFGMELSESCRFGSSGLNLAFEGLLLGASLHIPVEGTRSNPRQSGFWIPNMLNHAGEILIVVFCRKLKVSRASTRRLRWIDGATVHVTMRAEVVH
jgi:hypothetical protein